jgi:uncharacterized protein YhaN
MKIVELHIYGYGKLENISFRNMKMLQVFYGENESGKTTIMSFIHSVLFGFPTKVQNERRFEPKLNSKYGGRVILETHNFGVVTIERVKGKAVGDVTVTYENGTVGDDNDLKQILQGIDKGYFQSIFSFDLQGLQDLHTINEGTIGKYLLSTGIVGNDSLLAAETRLQKELDTRFKPSGQKPHINVLIKDLKDIQQQLKKADDVQNTYHRIIKEKQETELKLAQLKQDLTQNEQLLFKIQEYIRMKPLIEERDVLRARLGEIGEFFFPKDGLKRYEQLIQLKIPVQARLHSLKKKIHENEQKINNLNGHPYLIEYKDEVESIVENNALLENLELELEKLKHQLDNQDRVKAQYREEMSIEKSDEEILRIDTGAFIKEKVKELEREKYRLKNEKKQLDDRYKNAKNNLELSEARIKELESKLLPQEKRKQLEQTSNRQSTESENIIRARVADKQIEALRKKLNAATSRNQKRTKQIITFSMAAASILFGLSFYSWNQGNLLIAILTLAMAVIIMFTKMFISNDPFLSELKQELADAEKEKDEIARIKDSTAALETQSIGQLLTADDEHRKFLQAEGFKQEERELTFHAVINEFEQWEAEWKRVTDELSELMYKWGIPMDAMNVPAETALELLGKLKLVISETAKLQKDISSVDAEITIRKTNIFHVAGKLGITAAKWQEATFLIKGCLVDHTHNLAQRMHTVQETEELQDELDALELEIQHIDSEVKDLMGMAAAETEEEFRELAAMAEDKEHTEKQYQIINLQLQNSSRDNPKWSSDFFSKASYLTIETLEKQRKDLFSTHQKLLEAISGFNHEIARLEDGGTYDNLLHQFHEKKAEFNEEAKSWAKYALAKSLLNKTVEQFKLEKLPKIIRDAERYLDFLTNGEYKKIYLSDQGQEVSLERKDGLRFTSSEVSRGTAEQIYVALRFALSIHTYTDDTFPIIIDDSFVNFDRRRTNNILALLDKITGQRQVIFFTCHEHLLPFFEKESICILSQTENSIRAN